MRNLTIVFCVCLCSDSVSSLVYAEATINSEQKNSIRTQNPTIRPDADDSLEGRYDRFPKGNPTIEGGTAFKFILAGKDLSAIGHRINQYHWATMITPKFFVTADHTNVGKGFTFRFYRSADPADPSHRQDLVADKAAQKIGNTDLALGQMTQASSKPYHFWPVLRRQNLANPGQDPYSKYADNFYLYGQAAAPPTADTTTGRVFEDGNPLNSFDPRSQKFGTNAAGTRINGDNRTIGFRFDDVPDEFAPRRLSSGGGSFLLVGGKPIMAGIQGGISSYNSRDYDPSDYTITADKVKRIAFDLRLRLETGGFFTHVALGGRSDGLVSKMTEMQSDTPEHLRDRIVFYSIDSDNQHVAGDFDGDFAVTANDVDILVREVHMRDKLGQNRAYNWYLDWNSDGEINGKDVTEYLSEMGRTGGDVNWDGLVNFADFVALNANYDSSIEGKGWADGDFNGDGKTDFPDFLVLAHNFPGVMPPPPPGRLSEALATQSGDRHLWFGTTPGRRNRGTGSTRGIPPEVASPSDRSVAIANESDQDFASPLAAVPGPASAAYVQQPAIGSDANNGSEVHGWTIQTDPRCVVTAPSARSQPRRNRRRGGRLFRWRLLRR